jgi:hypothetical protein
MAQYFKDDPPAGDTFIRELVGDHPPSKIETTATSSYTPTQETQFHLPKFGHRGINTDNDGIEK